MTDDIKDDTTLDMDQGSTDVFNERIDEDELMLSTIDNPYSPKTEYYMWKRWDTERGYNTEEYIARLINMEEAYDVDDDFTLNILTTKVINDILENDEEELYRLM